MRREPSDRGGSTAPTLGAGAAPQADLTDDRTRDLLHVDERIGVAREAPSRPHAPDRWLDACGTLADRLHQWFGIPDTAIRYRSRLRAEVPNLAFPRDSLTVDHHEPIADDRDALVALVAAGVAVPEVWLDDA